MNGGCGVSVSHEATAHAHESHGHATIPSSAVHVTKIHGHAAASSSVAHGHETHGHATSSVHGGEKEVAKESRGTFCNGVKYRHQ